MAIYELHQDSIAALRLTSFAELEIRERQDLQRLLRTSIDVVAPDTLVISEEFGEWEDSRRRIDLLALDRRANLVVIELKRSDDGAHMELQALRYAAMVSSMTFTRAAEVYQRYLARNNRAQDDARQRILEFLDWDEPAAGAFAEDVSIVLVAANFSKEITTTVMWLNERELDIRCVRIQPYDLDGRRLIDVQQIVPLPEATDYQVQLKEKAAEQRARVAGDGRDFTRYDLRIGGQAYTAQNKRYLMYRVIRAAVESGVARDALPIPPSKWCQVQGDARDTESFIALAQTQLTPGRSFEVRRWFVKQDQLFHANGMTLALSNQWSGSDVRAAIDQIANRHPELGISYVASAP
jgi:hypothetical protein